MLVVIVAMVLAAIAIPPARSAIATYQLNAAVDAATGAIQTTRYQAIMHGYPYQIALYATNNTYQVLSEPPNSLAFASVGNPIPLSGSAITLSAATTLQFSPNGSVSAPLGQMNFSISYKGNAKTVTVSNYGSISIQ